MCAETIKAGAKVCPNCGSRQRRSGFLKGQLVAILILVTATVAFISLMEWLAPEEKDNPYSLLFPLHRREMVVERTSLESVGEKPDIWLSGYITNKGNQAWRVHELEVRISDSNNNLIDVQHPEFDKSDAFVVEPGHEHAFRIRLDSRANSNANVTVAVRVQHASDGRERYEPE